MATVSEHLETRKERKIKNYLKGKKQGVWGHSWVDVDLHMFVTRTVPDSNLGCLNGQLLFVCPLQMVAAGHTYRFGWID